MVTLNWQLLYLDWELLESHLQFGICYLQLKCTSNQIASL